MSASTYLIGKLINHTLRNTAYTSPADLWLSLHLGNPGGIGSNEASGGSYARAEAPTWNAPANRALTNAAEVSFGVQSTALGAISHIGVWDAETGGNFLWSLPIQGGLNLQIGGNPTFEIGQLRPEVTGSASLYLAHAWLNHVFRNLTFTSPGTSLYMGLHVFPPGLVGSGEVSGGSYARVQVADWSAPTGGKTTNEEDVQFPTPSGNWGGLTHYSLWDASASGNVLVIDQLLAEPYPYPAEIGDGKIGIGAGLLNVEVL